MPRKKAKRGSVALGFVLTVGILSLVTFALLEVEHGNHLRANPRQAALPIPGSCSDTRPATRCK